MTRAIVDLPLGMMTLTRLSWDIDWGGQSAGSDIAGGEQIVTNRFPRFVADLSFRFERDGIGPWRAFRARLEGRRNAVRLRLRDPATMQTVGAAADSAFEAWLSGLHVESRPRVTCLTAAAAGATTLSVDETAALAPIPVGAHLSYDDWPFLVVDRSGSGAAVTLTVKMLRTAIPAGGQIDLIPRGLFLCIDPGQGAVEYDRLQRITPAMSFAEWITR